MLVFLLILSGCYGADALRETVPVMTETVAAAPRPLADCFAGVWLREKDLPLETAITPDAVHLSLVIGGGISTRAHLWSMSLVPAAGDASRVELRSRGSLTGQWADEAEIRRILTRCAGATP